MRQGVSTVSIGKAKINWRVHVKMLELVLNNFTIMICACVQINEFQYYTLPVGYLIE